MADQKKYTNKLTSSRILIFGGSSGIGYSIAEASLEQGATVIISSSSSSKIQTAISALQAAYPSAKDRITGYVRDLSDANRLEESITSLFEEVGGKGKLLLDHIVFTAGDVYSLPKLAEVKIQDVHVRATVRFYAPLLTAKHAPKYLKPGPASSITLTSGSVAAERPLPGYSVIAGLASAIPGLMRGLAVDLAPIRVNAVLLGTVDTPLFDNFPPDLKEMVLESFKKGNLTGAVGRPEDVAEAYLYAMRDWNLTATIIRTNGGMLMK
jgi:NAD(P)-dependent dehydrogenase (short-subunit alcohol dehydrogenase family)